MGKHNRRPSRDRTVPIQHVSDVLDYIRYAQDGYSSLIDATTRKHHLRVGNRLMRDADERREHRRSEDYIRRCLFKK